MVVLDRVVGTDGIGGKLRNGIVDGSDGEDRGRRVRIGKGVGDSGFNRLGGELRVTPRAAVDVYVVPGEDRLRVTVREGVGRSADEL
jgi:hypothetical protein